MHFFITIGCLASYFYRMPSGDNWFGEGSSVKSLMIALISLGIGLMWLIVSCCGVIAVCLRCCPCLIVLTIATIAMAITLFSAGTLKVQIGNAVDDMCSSMEGEISEFFNRVVDKPMCSNMCPCHDGSLLLARMDYLTTDVME